jgi:hypothetical protein
MGYEDLNDHVELRHDPVMAVLAGKLEAFRDNCAPVAGKSTLNRLELSREAPTKYRKIAHVGAAIERLYGEGGRPCPTARKRYAPIRYRGFFVFLIAARRMTPCLPPCFICRLHPRHSLGGARRLFRSARPAGMQIDVGNCRLSKVRDYEPKTDGADFMQTVLKPASWPKNVARTPTCGDFSRSDRSHVAIARPNFGRLDQPSESSHGLHDFCPRKGALALTKKGENFALRVSSTYRNGGHFDARSRQQKCASRW